MKHTAALDPNHTHFILVDDGTELTYGGEIDLRSKLEEHISKLKTVGGESTCTLLFLSMKHTACHRIGYSNPNTQFTYLGLLFVLTGYSKCLALIPRSHQGCDRTATVLRPIF